MKKFLVGLGILVLFLFTANRLFDSMELTFYFSSDEPVTCFTSTEGNVILVDCGEGMEPFEIKGVDLGNSIPGHFPSEYAIDKETYLRWFRLIQEMGANTVRVYTIQSTEFYDAFYEYNNGKEEPLYLLHGVWVDDYVQNCHADAYDASFLDTFIKNSLSLVDVIHGQERRRLQGGTQVMTSIYEKDISQWVLGYILGVEWEDKTVIYTDEMQGERNSYQGDYMYTTADASAFEAMLAQVGDRVIRYETLKYHQQRLVAFSNGPSCDPFTYPEDVAVENRKYGIIDVEHIGTTEAFLAGQFASYHVYPYYPDYLGHYDEWKTQEWAEAYRSEDGTYNTYSAYLHMLVEHHQMPVVISEFGVPSSRGRAQMDMADGRSQGYLSETEQGEALVDCYQDIRQSGCAGSVIFSWQDEWSKEAWNTMANVDLEATAYWSDYQTNTQSFGLMTFDPGAEESVCCVDGEVSEWTKQDMVWSGEDGTSLSVKYDEKFFYLYINMPGFDPEHDILYLPFDITPKTGSFYALEEEVKFDRQADFLLVINGRDNSRLLVQERYDAFQAVFAEFYGHQNPYTHAPDADSPVFGRIYHAMQLKAVDHAGEVLEEAEKFETGKLTYGNADPDAPDYDSLADFMVNGTAIEIRLPWQLLNFGDPSKMMVHDDYYENYGIEFISIDELYIGIGSDSKKQQRIEMAKVLLKGWEYEPTYHERLKKSYDMMKAIWADGAAGGN